MPTTIPRTIAPPIAPPTIAPMGVFLEDDWELVGGAEVAE